MDKYVHLTAKKCITILGYSSDASQQACGLLAHWTINEHNYKSFDLWRSLNLRVSTSLNTVDPKVRDDQLYASLIVNLLSIIGDFHYIAQHGRRLEN